VVECLPDPGGQAACRAALADITINGTTIRLVQHG
jgi:hypothetical protein